MDDSYKVIESVRLVPYREEPASHPLLVLALSLKDQC